MGIVGGWVILHCCFGVVVLVFVYFFGLLVFVCPFIFATFRGE